MKRRLKVYFIHSNKMDYKNLLYRYILSSPVAIVHELMLPQTKKYQDKYVKDLLNSADIVIAEVSFPSFLLKLELKWALKSGKPIKYISLNNIISKKLKKVVPEIEMITDENTLTNIIENFITYYSSKSLEELQDPTIIFGE
ncbi:MAG: hypothetical protein PHF21_04890, partial [Bacilli bacterium]|nr:hypothetical protein [Bacilli bacterium]